MTSNGTYIFNTASDLGGEQVRYLERIYDGWTKDLLDSTGLRAGWRGLELGVGGGSIARWMAGRSFPEKVVAVDVDTARVEPTPGVDVHVHDINDGIPVDGQFDIIHARLLLLHLPRRLEILEKLVESLAPGGWLVLGDFGPRLPEAITVPDPADRHAFDRILEVGHGTVGPAAGQSLEWAADCGRHMKNAGLVDICSREHSYIVNGADTGARYIHNLMTQIERPLVDAGLAPEEFDRGRALLTNPRFRGWFYQFIGTRGRKPKERAGGMA